MKTGSRGACTPSTADISGGVAAAAILVKQAVLRTKETSPAPSKPIAEVPSGESGNAEFPQDDLQREKKNPPAGRRAGVKIVPVDVDATNIHMTATSRTHLRVTPGTAPIITNKTGVCRIQERLASVEKASRFFMGTNRPGTERATAAAEGGRVKGARSVPFNLIKGTHPTASVLPAWRWLA